MIFLFSEKKEKYNEKSIISKCEGGKSDKGGGGYYATFPEAVKILIGEEGEGRQKSCPAPSKDFRLPEKNEDNEKS